MDFGCVSLESWGCALHLDSLANRAYLQGHVSANDSVKCYLNVFSLIGLESLARDLDRVSPWHHVCEIVIAR